MALRSFAEEGEVRDVHPDIWRAIVESGEVHSRWVLALANDDLEFVGWDETSPGGPYAVWLIKSTGEGIAT